MTHLPRPKLRGLFVTGTDTGVGKTAVSVALLRLARNQGIALLPFKPVETGCAGKAPRDALRLRAASCRPDLPLTWVCPYPFDPPTAPAAAAAERRMRIVPARLFSRAATLAREGDALLVEGAGGLLSPYGPSLTGADLAAGLGLPLLLVARNGLGTINHTALCLAEIRRRRLPFAGLMLVDTSPAPTPDRATNADLIAALTGERALGTLPYVKGMSPDRLARALAASFDATTLLQRWLRGPQRRLSSAELAVRSRRASSGK
jgi:dethiobiotin synthetase